MFPTTSDVTFTPHTAPLYKIYNLMFDCRDELLPAIMQQVITSSSAKPLNLDRRNPGYPDCRVSPKTSFKKFSPDHYSIINLRGNLSFRPKDGIYG
jgi:hypothetical protein